MTIEENDDILPNAEDCNNGFVNKTLPKTTHSLETRIAVLQNDNKETKRLPRQILERMKTNETESRPRLLANKKSPTRYMYNRQDLIV